MGAGARLAHLRGRGFGEARIRVGVGGRLRGLRMNMVGVWLGTGDHAGVELEGRAQLRYCVWPRLRARVNAGAMRRPAMRVRPRGGVMPAKAGASSPAGCPGQRERAARELSAGCRAARCPYTDFNTRA